MKPPHMLQRCSVKYTFKDTMKTSEYLAFDYMGSSEFEFGALPRFQREIHPKLDRMEIYAVHHQGTTLHMLVEPSQEVEYAQHVRDLIDDKLRLMERSGLRDHEDYYDTKSPFRYDVWWDLDNAVAIARDPQVLRNLKTTVRNSIKYMNEAKADARGK